MLSATIDVRTTSARKCSRISMNTGDRNEDIPPQNDEAITILKNGLKNYLISLLKR
jgi:hypothetical protein